MADLEAFRDNASTPTELAKVSKHFLDHYSFPVMMVVAYPNGTVANKVNANKFLDAQPQFVVTAFGEPSANQYVDFLKEGIRRIQKGEAAPL